MKANNRGSIISILLIALVLLIQTASCGPLAMGICYTGCNIVWVACVSAGGGVAGVSTGGAGVIPAILGCNAAQGSCMAACTVALALPSP
eukprot:403376941